MIESAFEVLSTLVILLLVWMVFVKGPLVRLWWPLVAPIAHPLGFRCVVMDISFGIHSIRWRRQWLSPAIGGDRDD